MSPAPEPAEAPLPIDPSQNIASSSSNIICWLARNGLVGPFDVAFSHIRFSSLELDFVCFVFLLDGVLLPVPDELELKSHPPHLSRRAWLSSLSPCACSKCSKSAISKSNCSLSHFGPISHRFILSRSSHCRLLALDLLW